MAESSSLNLLAVRQEDDVPIKIEQDDEMAWPFETGDIINLLSDESEDELISGPATHEQANNSLSGAVSASKAKENPKSAQKLSTLSTLKAKQAEYANRFRAKQAAQKKTIPATDSIAEDPLTGDVPVERADSMILSDSVDSTPSKSFADLRKEYELKKRTGTLSIEAEIDFMRHESLEMSRRRKEREAEDYSFGGIDDDDDEDDGLFVREKTKTVKYSDMYSEDDEPQESKKKGRKKRARDDEEDLSPRPHKRANTKSTSSKKGKKVLGTAYTEEDVEDVLSSMQAGPKKRAAAKKSTTKRPKKGGAHEMTNIGSVLGTNVFNDRAAVADLDNQPAAYQDRGQRAMALKQLIASVPMESKKVAGQDKKILNDAIREFDKQAVRPASDGNWNVRGMRTTLKHYQVLGVGWMRKRENAARPPHGGILADEMGLGKTIMSLACIVNGRRPPKSTKAKATLIICSPALAGQWFNEIKTHCLPKSEDKQHGIGAVRMYRPATRQVFDHDPKLLEDAEIVLSCYSDVNRSYPKAEPPENLVTAAEKDQWWTKFYEEEKGTLHRIKWHRILLDEAHAIKNHRSHTSLACRALDGDTHWAITGTPIQNTVKEFYPYFKFLREPYTGSYKIFKNNYSSKDDPDGGDRLHVMLRKNMCRRTHLSKMFNAKLLDLPQPREHTVWLEFSDIVKKRFIARINTISKQDGLEKQYSHIWTMLLRLRQITSHVLLVQTCLMDLLERDDFERLNKITPASDDTSGADILHHLRHVLKTKAEAKATDGRPGHNTILTETEILPTGVVDYVNSEKGLGGKFGRSAHFKRYLDSIKRSDRWNDIAGRTKCTGCRQPPQDPVVTSCGHIYCEICVTDLQHYAARRGENCARCQACGEEYTSTQPCQEADDSQVRDTSTSTSEGDLPKKGKMKSDDLDWIGMKGEVLPSAKTRAVKAQVLEWIDEDKQSKIIIYTQFLPVVRILGRICETEDWTYIKYTGEMSQSARDKAISDFGSKPEIKIMLASLRAGGLGLNLTMASKVIMVDSWWNESVEQQAFCRVFRIGQTKETEMTRFVVANTIDENMMDLKERKQIEIDEVMDDSKKRADLSVHDLMRLFGRVVEDDEGRPFIWAREDEPEHLRLANVDDLDDEEGFMGNEA